MNDELKGGAKKALKTQLWGGIPSIEVQVIPESSKEWRSCIVAAQKRFLPLNKDQRLNALVANDEDMLLLALHRVVQRHWRTNHKIPCRLSVAQRAAINAYGDLWWQRLRLCERLHSYSFWGDEYKNAADWFLHLVLEWRTQCFQAVTQQEIVKGKTVLTELIQGEMNQLYEGINPEDENVSPHYWRLIKTALAFEGSNDQFRKEFWKPYLQARNGWKRELNRNENLRCIFLENENFYLPTGGKGKGRIKLFQNLTAEMPSV